MISRIGFRRRVEATDVLKGFAAGVLGGALACCMTNRFLALTSKRSAHGPLGGEEEQPDRAWDRGEHAEAAGSESDFERAGFAVSSPSPSASFSTAARPSSATSSWSPESGRGEESEAEEDENATVKVATAISEKVLSRPLPEDRKQQAGQAVHYGFGTLVGGLYGAVAEEAPVLAIAGGVPFGAALWLAADEVAVPALRLAPPPTHVPAKTHLSALGAHLVYGLVLEGVRRGVRALW